MRIKIEITIWVILLLVSIGFMIYGIVMSVNLTALDYATQIQKYGFYKDDIHILPNYYSDDLKYILITVIPFVCTMVGILINVVIEELVY